MYLYAFQQNLTTVLDFVYRNTDLLTSLLHNRLISSSNHRLESAGLNALEELLFKMLRVSGEDSIVCLVCKGNCIFEGPLY